MKAILTKTNITLQKTWLDRIIFKRRSVMKEKKEHGYYKNLQLELLKDVKIK